jgi:hypothetical protein
MSVANLAYRDPSELPAGLPPELRKAQEAMFLPEIRQILKKLAEYNLGVCMPHKHNEETGRFETLPEEVVQVERALTVTFEPVTALKDRASYVPVRVDVAGRRCDGRHSVQERMLHKAGRHATLQQTRYDVNARHGNEPGVSF